MPSSSRGSSHRVSAQGQFVLGDAVKIAVNDLVGGRYENGSAAVDTAQLYQFSVTIPILSYYSNSQLLSEFSTHHSPVSIITT